MIKIDSCLEFFEKINERWFVDGDLILKTVKNENDKIIITINDEYVYSE